MSKYLTFDSVQFRDQACLVKALNEMGYADVEVGTNLHLFGYTGDRRSTTADVVVRRKYIPGPSNDLGFAKTENGYVPIISEYDSTAGLNEAFRNKLKVQYNEQIAREVARRLHGTVQRRVEGGVVKMVVRY